MPVLVLAMAAAPAAAHKLNVFARVEGKTIRGEAYYRGQVPARGAAVSALDPAGEKLGETTTDDEGKFSLDARFRCDHRLVVDAGGGHSAETTVRADEFPSDLPDRGTSSVSPSTPDAGKAPGVKTPEEPVAPDVPKTLDVQETSRRSDLEALAVQVGKLREEIDQYRNETRFHDVIGGIGYIAGIMGLIMYLAACRKVVSAHSNASASRASSRAISR